MALMRIVGFSLIIFWLQLVFNRDNRAGLGCVKDVAI